MRIAVPFIFLLVFKISFAQSKTDSTYKTVKSTFYTNTNSNHPFGVFISRMENNFQFSAEDKISISFGINSGNVWLPYVKSFEPINQSDRDLVGRKIWPERQWFFYNIYKINKVKTTELHADGLIRQYQLKLNIPLNKKQELKISSRIISLDPGNVPVSLLTSDQFLEWFHTNIHGGEDPFARKDYGFNKAKIRYKDKNGRVLQMYNGDVIFTGINLSYFYYPDFKGLARRNIYTNFGSQLGINTSKYNPSIDLGINSTIVKKFEFKKSRDLNIGLTLGALRQKLVKFGNAVQMSDKQFIYNGELLVEFVKHFSKKSYFSVATTYNAQSRYFKREGFDYLVLTGDRITSHWHYAYTHLYKYLAGNNLIFTFSRGKFIYWAYLREDFAVDNSPDSQVGIGIRYEL